MIVVSAMAWSGCAPAGPVVVAPVDDLVASEPMCATYDAPVLDWVESPTDPASVMVEVNGISTSATERLAQLDLKDEQWQSILRVIVDRDGTRRDTRTPIVGTYSAVEGSIRFRPRFPLDRGVHYAARFDPSALIELTGEGTSSGSTEAIESTFHLSEREASAPAEVVAVFPKAARLPENLLKFYVHFSGPMGRGEAYRHLHLLDMGGREVSAPFLELGEELWDPSGTRFTLLLDPGRIKRGLKPREELGPVLEEGKSYTLVIDRDWADAWGRPLREPFRKDFRVNPPDDAPPDPSKWIVDAPRGETTGPLALRFPEPLDHAMLGRVLSVEDERGGRIEGRVEVDPDATRWRFTPARPWPRGEFRVVVDADLEDLAGNSIGRPFEVDVAEPITDRVEAETVTVRFQVR